MRNLEEIKRINLVNFLLQEGFEINKYKSSKACTVMKKNDVKVGVSYNPDRGHWLYYNFSKNQGGTIIDFLQNEKGLSFPEIIKLIREDDFTPHSAPVVYSKPQVQPFNREKVRKEFEKCRVINNKHFLHSRGIRKTTYLSDRFKKTIFTDYYNNVIFPHYDKKGLCGLEKKNYKFTGFSEFGRKGLWCSKRQTHDNSIRLFETGIDALSYYQLKDDAQSFYFSIGGNFSKNIQSDLIKYIIEKYRMDIYLCFDNDEGGKKMIERIKKIFPSISFKIDIPQEKGADWNDVLFC